MPGIKWNAETSLNALSSRTLSPEIGNTEQLIEMLKYPIDPKGLKVINKYLVDYPQAVNEIKRGLGEYRELRLAWSLFYRDDILRVGILTAITGLRIVFPDGMILSDNDFTGSSLRRIGLFSADLRGTKFTGADLSEADLFESDLRGAILSGAILSEAILSNTKLGGVNLRWAKLGGAKLRVANLVRADLSEADLSKADLSEADLRWANLVRADLREADLRGTKFTGADLIEAKLNGINLIGAIIFGKDKSDIASIRERLKKAGVPFDKTTQFVLSESDIKR